MDDHCIATKLAEATLHHTVVNGEEEGGAPSFPNCYLISTSDSYTHPNLELGKKNACV